MDVAQTLDHIGPTAKAAPYPDTHPISQGTQTPRYPTVHQFA